MRDVDLSHIFALEKPLRALEEISPSAAVAVLVLFVLGAWALGAVIDSI